MGAEVWGVIAAFAGVVAAFTAVFVAAFFYLLSAIQRVGLEVRTELREERNARQAEIQEERRQREEERRERQAEIQRLFDALYRHRHDQSDQRTSPPTMTRSPRLAESWKRGARLCAPAF